MKYKIITENKTGSAEPETILAEQLRKRNVLNINGKQNICFLISDWRDSDFTTEMEIDNAIQCLSIKEGVDMVQFENGNYGFVAYYNDKVDAFEII